MNAPAAGAESLPAWDLEAIYASAKSGQPVYFD